ncbi:MAG: DUF58 domain-containing protein [Nannocystis sp.]|nr:DUF58 domain-containing protein [Nannocystis sp.]
MVGDAADSDPLGLLPAELRELLRGRVLALERPVWGDRSGRHAAARAGGGVTFRGHRPYVAGDDPRRLDWRAIARRDRPVVRVADAEDQLSLVLLLDGSGGMSYGTGPSQKARYGGALALALAHLALRQGDSVGFAAAGDGAIAAPYVRPSGGEGRLMALARAIEGLPLRGTAPWSALLDDVAGRMPRRALVVLISDLLDPCAGEPDPGAEAGLVERFAGLRARGHDLVIVQVLHADERSFPWQGPELLRFVDPRGARAELEAAAPGLRAGYLRRLAAHQEGLRAACERGGVFLVETCSAQPLSESLLALLGRLSGVEPALDAR